MMNNNPNTIRFPIPVEQDESKAYIVSCPLFKACHSYGKTIDEALENIKDVIQLCVDEEREELQNMNQFIGFHELEVNVAAA